MRFRKKAKLLPGVYLNFSKSGISTTIGISGASINIGKKGAYFNSGIPGTGIYDRQRIGGGNKRNQKSHIEDFQIPFEEIPTSEILPIKTEQVEEDRKSVV